MTSATQPARLHCAARAVAASPSVEQVIAAAARRNQPFVLDSADRRRRFGRFTIIGFEPVETFVADDFEPAKVKTMQSTSRRVTCMRYPWDVPRPHLSDQKPSESNSSTHELRSSWTGAVLSAKRRDFKPMTWAWVSHRFARGVPAGQWRC